MAQFSPNEFNLAVQRIVIVFGFHLDYKDDSILSDAN